jgi:hypothetical protein
VELIKLYLIKAYTPKVKLQWPMNLEHSNRYKNDFWVTKEGLCVMPEHMDNRHLLNTIRIIHRSNPILKHYMEAWNAESFIIYGPEAFALPLQKKMDHVNKVKYRGLWKEFRIYMRLRQEAVFRKLKVEE